MHGTMIETVAHEFPAGILAGLGHARIIKAHPGIDRKRWPNLQPLIERMEAPETHAHAVLVPTPVGNVGQRRNTRWRHEHLPRHGARDVPNLHVNYGPNHNAFAARQMQFWPI